MSSQTTNFIKRLRSTRALGRVEVSQPPLFFFFCFSLYDLAVFFYLLSSKLSYTQKHPSFLLLLFFFSPSSSFLSSFFVKSLSFCLCGRAAPLATLYMYLERILEAYLYLAVGLLSFCLLRLKLVCTLPKRGVRRQTTTPTTTTKKREQKKKVGHILVELTRESQQQ